jgi:hypothetical protein
MLFEEISFTHAKWKVEDDRTNFEHVFVERAKKAAENLRLHIQGQVEAFKSEHPEGRVFGLNGSFRQDFEHDKHNRDNQDRWFVRYLENPANALVNPLAENHSYLMNWYSRIVEEAWYGVQTTGKFKESIPSGRDGLGNLVCVEDGNFDFIFKLLGIEYMPQLYADGDGETGSSRGKMEKSVKESFWQLKRSTLKNAIGEPIQEHGQGRGGVEGDKQGLVEFHFAKMAERFPGAELQMVFYDDKTELLKDIEKKVPMKTSWSFTAVPFDAFFPESGVDKDGFMPEVRDTVTGTVS